MNDAGRKWISKPSSGIQLGSSNLNKNVEAMHSASKHFFILWNFLKTMLQSFSQFMSLAELPKLNENKSINAHPTTNFHYKLPCSRKLQCSRMVNHN